MKYTQSHDWISIKGNIGTVGITKYAQKELGEVVYVELPLVGSIVTSGEEVVVLESTKAAADIYAPLSGKVIKVNTPLTENVAFLNEQPEGQGWLYQVEFQKEEELSGLKSREEYLQMVE